MRSFPILMKTAYEAWRRNGFQAVDNALAGYCIARCFDLRGVFSAVVLGVFLCFVTGVTHATVPDGLRLDYRVLRNGSEIGHNKMRFSHDGDALLTVETEIRISVSLLSITLYSYRLDAREIWHGDRLVAFQSTTDDNGDSHAVRAVAEGDKLVVDTDTNHWMAPATIVPTSLWHRRMAQGSLLIGIERGEAITVSFVAAGRETVSARGGEVDAVKIVVSGALERELWYDDDGILVRLSLTRDGSVITYELK